MSYKLGKKGKGVATLQNVSWFEEILWWWWSIINDTLSCVWKNQSITARHVLTDEIKRLSIEAANAPDNLAAASVDKVLSHSASGVRAELMNYETMLEGLNKVCMFAVLLVFLILLFFIITYVFLCQNINSSSVVSTILPLTLINPQPQQPVSVSPVSILCFPGSMAPERRFCLVIPSLMLIGKTLVEVVVLGHQRCRRCLRELNPVCLFFKSIF